MLNNNNARFNAEQGTRHITRVPSTKWTTNLATKAGKQTNTLGSIHQLETPCSDNALGGRILTSQLTCYPDKFFLNEHTLTITHPHTGEPSARIPTHPAAEYSITCQIPMPFTASASFRVFRKDHTRVDQGFHELNEFRSS